MYLGSLPLATGPLPIFAISFTVPALIIHADQISLPEPRVPQINQLCCLTYNFDDVLKIALKINAVRTLVSCEAENKR
jgi:hypothetical protein